MTFSGSDLSNVLGTAIAAGAVVRVVDTTMGKGGRARTRAVVKRRAVKSSAKPRSKPRSVKKTSKKKKWSVWNV